MILQMKFEIAIYDGHAFDTMQSAACLGVVEVWPGQSDLQGHLVLKTSHSRTEDSHVSNFTCQTDVLKMP